MTDHTIIQPLGPRKIGKYQIEAMLGKGAMGVVYAGHDPDIDRPVAIKTVHRHLVDAAGGEDWLARFAREARAAGRVLHPNLVTIFDYLEQDNVPYIVMEKIRSITLEDRLAKPEGLDLQEVLQIMGQILDGLSCIHAAGIVHRDMKPANVMLTETGTVKLTDFGIARITTMDKTGAGMIGTPSYMAPEQFSGAEVDARADIYGLGVLLFEVLTGRLPFEGGGIEALLLAARDGLATKPSEIVPDLSDLLDAVVLKAMAVAPEDRFANANEMKLALTAAVDGTGAVTLSTAARPKHIPTDASETMLSRMSAATMTQVERNLVTKIGPMGQVIARRAAAKATTDDELLELVLSELRQGEEQTDMRASLVRLLSSNVRPAHAGISDADLQRLTTLLKQYLGPISTVLVKREAANAGSITDLIRALATNINRADEKATFLAAAAVTDEKGHPHA